MNTTIASHSRLAAAGALAAMLAVLAPIRAEAVIAIIRTGIVGITQGQTARLNVANAGPTQPADPDRACEGQLVFLDGEGNRVGEVGFVIVDGKSAFLDLNANDLGGPDTRPGERFPVRGVVVIDPNGNRVCRSLVATLEVLDNETGKTEIVLPYIE